MFAETRAAVVGLGRSGVAAARLLLAAGARVRLIDQQDARCREVATMLEQGLDDVAGRVEIAAGPHHAGQFDGMDVAIMSPGVAVAKIRPFLPQANPPQVLAEMELASRFVQAPILAVTGTSGKTTTVTLAARMLEAAGKKVFLGGNIGTPLAEFVLSGETADVLVLEISSFQLQTCTTFHPRVGVFLNLAPNHLDYHADMEEYLQAKCMLFAQQTAADVAVVHASLRPLIEARGGLHASVRWFDEQAELSAGALLGAHNRANVQAAYLATSCFGVSKAQAQAAVDAFAPLPHRIQPVAEVKGVLFVNDSKATTPDAMAAAIRSMDRPVRLLAGGVFKGGDLTELTPLIREKVRQVALFGANRDVFEQAWQGVAPLSWDDTLEQAARRLFAEAQPGEAILLSPATASFDRYSSYTERGKDFMRVAALLEEEQA
ncbi:putative UDP-N-acetylmuramoylalanine--D-glutamate ligase [Megalodesulfovibrio gigas DSM 1382 = ATCC 19364]|uniref:UDP-N-acetylmuramoylalanine--D-glutamate ligase n=1 Tax=Megalodesulfovibrio gigas (strain ATCC 19364 / DSM 1382 / NCIMB 9332 / VKM B-1759) TaxID=1121448 RepID=T2G6R0_MEGG1|nr:putative UDP-N-acetylmuramoylalanine--D-glutamate ligase [Megalodesulfovibrio gigas DSM 1382 = ATCC 19364]